MDSPPDSVSKDQTLLTPDLEEPTYGSLLTPPEAFRKNHPTYINPGSQWLSCWVCLDGSTWPQMMW